MKSAGHHSIISTMIEKETDTYKLHIKGEVQYLTFKRLDEFPELRHLFTTRHGGISTGCRESWDLGFSEEDGPEAREYNCGVLADVMGIAQGDMVWTQQTHTTNIRRVTEDDRGKGATRPRDYTDVDGLVTDCRGIALVTTHADCNALYFYDPLKHVIGLAHSGWKGTLHRIGKVMVNKMQADFGSDPGELVCGIGPSLCQDCFEVDRDVAGMFSAADAAYGKFAYEKGVKTYIDLWAINEYILQGAGVRPENILCMGLCTKENTDMFFSHRGQHGKRGTMAAAMLLK